ncbi:MAG: hypothetical protein WAQ05_26380 [Rubrivivax sp.]
MPNWRVVAAVAALAGYALLSYGLMAWWPERPWTVAALFGPLIAAMAIGGLARRHLPTLLGCAALVLVVVVAARAGGVDLNRLYVLQHGALHALLAWSFGLTLRRGATPLITLLAERIHDVFTPAMRAYTRWLTQVWVCYFLGMIVLSLLIYALAPWPWWSFFCNIVTPVSAIALFVGEYMLRYRRHPEFERATLAQALKAYRAGSQP